MSITLNHNDFQCLQDQLVDLKTKNYELAEKNRRGQADFEAAKAKICSLQLKLEEQERDFEVTSATLRREIEVAYNSAGGSYSNEDDADADGKGEGNYRAKYKKLLHKAKELQQRYEKSLEVIQQMDDQIKSLTVKLSEHDEETARLKQTLEEKTRAIATLQEELSKNLNSAIEEYKSSAGNDCREHIDQMNAIKDERDILRSEVDKLRTEVKAFNEKLECQAEERKIQDRKGAQIIKAMKRQLVQERNRNETLQKRLESLLSHPSADQLAADAAVPNSGGAIVDTESKDSKLSTSSSTNGNSRDSRGDNFSGQQRDDHSVSSWSLVPGKTTSTPSICSIESEDHETVHSPNKNSCDILSEPCSPSQPALSPRNNSRSATSSNSNNIISNESQSDSSNKCSNKPSIGSMFQNSSNDLFAIGKRASSSMLNHGNTTAGSSESGLRFEDQAALMERVTSLQHDKWTLEEKLSYLEQANAALTQDLADKSHVIRQYFMDQAMRSASHHNHSYDSTNYNPNTTTMSDSSSSTSRRVSFPNNINQLLTDKPSLKKMVDFLKERSQVSSAESDSVTREATKKMQVMLEETLIKCIKLQENLDYVTSELNRLQM